jgi:hypothetical protein
MNRQIDLTPFFAQAMPLELQAGILTFLSREDLSYGGYAHVQCHYQSRGGELQAAFYFTVPYDAVFAGNWDYLFEIASRYGRATSEMLFSDGGPTQAELRERFEERELAQWCVV